VTQGIRAPAVAGTFYPEDPARLGALTRALLDRAAAGGAAEATAVLPKALIVPHAALRFSGTVAARAYARVAPAGIERVVLFGPSHRVPVDGLGLPSAEAFATPLGKIPLDLDNLEVLKEQSYARVSDAAHASEHSLEVQLPLLQALLGDFRLTPVAVGRAEANVVDDALARVWGGPETLIVISSDLSHYHPYAEAQRRDTTTSMAIMGLAGRLRGQDACGWRPVNGMLLRARNAGLLPETIDLRNSGDTQSNRERVVGYGAWAFADSAGRARAPLDETGRGELLRVAAQSVRRGVAGKPQAAVSVATFAATLQQPGASFITLTRNGKLRGCLGSLRAYRPLVLDVAERGHAATCKDQRFPPVQPGELPGMHVEVSVLSTPERMEFSGEDELLSRLRPGTDGLIFEDQGKRATFLPKVWEEIGEPRRFVQRLKQKAGLPPDHWSGTVRGWRYQTERFGFSFGSSAEPAPPAA
jgi:AmmeMemoRadiSam system protein B/AmmeMemoRadiSam system protein A